MKVLFSSHSPAVRQRVAAIVDLVGNVTLIEGSVEQLTPDVALIVATSDDNALIDAARAAHVSHEIITPADQ